MDDAKRQSTVREDNARPPRRSGQTSASDDRVVPEYAKVQFLHAAKLKILERTAIEFFDGPHPINGQCTLRFLYQYLDWPEPE